MGVQACRLPGLKPLKGLKGLKGLKPLKACRSPGVTGFKPFKRLNILLACLIPQPTGAPRPHQWLLMGVQACRLPGLKPLKGLKGLKPLKACRSPGVTGFKPFKRLNILLACLIPQPTGTPRPHQWLLMGVQACHLPGLKPLKGFYPKARSIASSWRPSLHCLVAASRPPFASLQSLATLSCWGFKGGSAAPGR